MATAEPPHLEGEKIHKYGLKIKLFVLNCRLDNRSLGPSIAENFKAHNLDYCDAGPSIVFDTLENSKFLQYSTLVIVINGYCLCHIVVLEALLYCIRKNKYLRYKSKLFIINNVERCGCRYRRTWLQPEEKQLNCGKYDNVIMFQNNVQAEFDISQCFLIMLLIAQATPFVSIQEVLKPAQRPTKHEVVRTCTTADLYLYTINPALAIIINNYYFTKPLDIRQGSEQDVVNLIRELKIARIPYILIEDCARQELMQILDYIEKKDFQPLKSFLFFLMSHGDEDNIIYTHDGQLNAKKEVVEKIQANKSLENTETLIVLNSCRGPIDMQYADCFDLEEIENTPPSDASHLKRNTMVLYGVPKGLQSPRDIQRGCPLISSFCQHFRNTDHTDDIRQLVNEQIDKDLQQFQYFKGLEQISELMINDPTKARHAIMQLPTNAVSMIQLIDSILKDFPTFPNASQDREVVTKADEDHEDDHYPLRSMFYICGTLNERKFPKISIVQKYFAAELDRD